MKNDEKIQELINASAQVLGDCMMPGGGIVAANTRKRNYPREAKNYMFVWPRDGAFICQAAELIDLHISEKFFSWCISAESWPTEGVFFKKYYLNGRKAQPQFQPDQSGSILFVACKLWQLNAVNNTTLLNKLVSHTADGICKVWNNNHFKWAAQDIWEERLCFPDLEEFFTYSLATCIAGLSEALKINDKSKWEKTRDQMKQLLLSQPGAHYGRTYGKLPDSRVDASLLGLLYPYNIIPANDSKFLKTIELIEEHLVKDFGVHRYEHDEYDGWVYQKETNRKKGAGYWPLLNFWMAIVQHKMGNTQKAMFYYNKVLDDLKENLIPEQIFNNDIQVSVKPLAWSHSMFLLATKELGLM
ncbi:MAG: hypothetical protein GVY19_06595 [Bacteroidetes bacterium]|jgi:GH15 family glucan-1,4-alpha-glucosidase|nr:hypothetical protein [Bacteroidota bacterium]